MIVHIGGARSENPGRGLAFIGANSSIPNQPWMKNRLFSMPQPGRPREMGLHGHSKTMRAITSWSLAGEDGKVKGADQLEAEPVTFAVVAQRAPVGLRRLRPYRFCSNDPPGRSGQFSP